jgi:hypothetical protein
VRENARQKAARLLVEGRLSVLVVAEGEIVAAVKGDSGEVHRVRYSRGRWSCDTVRRWGRARTAWRRPLSRSFRLPVAGVT